MDKDVLSANAKKVLEKTILAADESTATIKKRFDTIGLESTPETNRQYRQLLFTTSEIEKYISGVIMFDETIRQSAHDGTPFPQLLEQKGIFPGIKVDKGTVKGAQDSIDTTTEGIDGLDERLEEYRSMGAKFAKWRAVFTITEQNPSYENMKQNATNLAQYAFKCQQANIVPIVEPEVLTEGNHTLAIGKEVTQTVLSTVFEALEDAHVFLGGIILKPNMVTAGKDHPLESVQDVATTTLEVLKQIVPSDVPGIAFLSGGQGADSATNHLNAINIIKNQHPNDYPWRITASYGRALQDETLKTWSGKQENIQTAQNIFLERAEKVYKASLGQLTP